MGELRIDTKSPTLRISFCVHPWHYLWYESTVRLWDQTSAVTMTLTLHNISIHAIGVCLPANQHPNSTIKKKAHKPLRTLRIYQKIYLPCLLIIQSCYLSHVLTVWSACRPLVTWSWCTTCVKDHGLFIFNYPQINKVRNSDHMDFSSENLTIFQKNQFLWCHPI